METTNPLVDCGRRLRALRLALGLSQLGLAEKVGVAGPTVNRWEQGLREPDLADRLTLTGVLGSDPYAIETPEAAAS